MEQQINEANQPKADHEFLYGSSNFEQLHSEPIIKEKVNPDEDEDNNYELELEMSDEVSLFDMGCNTVDVSTWRNQIIEKPILSNLYVERIRENQTPNVKILIDGTEFLCQLMVLQCFSEYFAECAKEKVIKLPVEKVTSESFKLAYDWMLSDEPAIHRKAILDVLYAAEFLRIPHLSSHCWQYIGDPHCFNEDSALMLFMEARKYNYESVQRVLLNRINKCFLSFVASEDFLHLTSKELIALLGSSAIGVNTEIEVLMSAVLWFSYNWTEREQYLLDIFKCIRFRLMPAWWFAIALKKSDDSSEVEPSANHPDINRMIYSGLEYVSAVSCDANEESTLVWDLKLDIPNQREWIYDKQCPYHTCIVCNRFKFVSYGAFLNYLEKIRTFGKGYYKSVDLLDDLGGIEGPCSIHSD